MSIPEALYHDPEERRQDKRIPKNLRVEFREFKFPLVQQPTREARCIDISAGGMCISCSEQYSEQTKLQVKIFIPGFNKYHPGYFKVFESDAGQFFQAIAELVRVKEVLPLSRYELGIQFLDIDSQDWSALRKFILRTG